MLDALLERCRALGWLTARGRRRADSPRVPAAIRVRNRLELAAETLRAALNELAPVAPDWLRGIAPVRGYGRYGKRIEGARLPKEEATRHAYARMAGAAGFHSLDALEAPEAPARVRAFPMSKTLRRAWRRHYERSPAPGAAQGSPPGSRVRFTSNRERPRAAGGIASPYDAEARCRNRRDTQRTGDMVPAGETCEPPAPHRLTHVPTPPATVREARCAAPIRQARVGQDVPPREHLVGAAYIAAALLVDGREGHGILLRGPARPSPGRQAQVEGAYTIDRFIGAWARQVVTRPQGECAAMRAARVDRRRARAGLIVALRSQDCAACVARSRRTRAESTGRRLHLPPQGRCEAPRAARAWYASAGGRQRHQCRAGIDGPLSPGGRAFGLRRPR